MRCRGYQACQNKRIMCSFHQPLHMKYKLQMEPARVLEMVKEASAMRGAFCDDVEWSAEDATRTEADFSLRTVEAAMRRRSR